MTYIYLFKEIFYHFIILKKLVVKNFLYKSPCKSFSLSVNYNILKKNIMPPPCLFFTNI